MNADLKLPVAANDIEKLCIIVGMGNGMPVAAVFGRGDVTKLHLILRPLFLCLVDDIMNMAHNRLSFVRNIAVSI